MVLKGYKFQEDKYQNATICINKKEHCAGVPFLTTIFF